MFITLAGMSIDVRLLQPAKAFLPMVVTFAGISIDVSLLHPSNTQSPILVTLAGIFIEVRLLHPEKVICPISVTLAGMSIDVRPLQPSKSTSNDFCHACRNNGIFTSLKQAIITFSYNGIAVIAAVIYTVPTFHCYRC